MMESVKVKAVSVKVYNWASSLTTEGKTRDDKFYETGFLKLLLFKIQTTKRSLIVVSGLQGTGKTRILDELSNRLEKSISFKWTRGWEKDALDWVDVNGEYMESLYDEAAGILGEFRESRMAHPVLKRVPLREDLFVKNFNSTLLERIVGKSRCNELKKEALTNYLRHSKAILIDMPDYSKTSVGLMQVDIDELQRFWELVRGLDINIVIAVQKELVMKHQHFFWGKCDIMTLKPLTEDELLEAYKFTTEDTQLFTEEALRLMARLSRGIFRRFKKYVRLIIERNLNENIPTTRQGVKAAISEEELFEDMELELSDIFADREKRMQAVKLLSFLQENANSNIKTLAENTGLSEFVAAKLVERLSLYGYLAVTHGRGKELLVSLKP